MVVSSFNTLPSKFLFSSSDRSSNILSNLFVLEGLAAPFPKEMSTVCSLPP